MDNPAAEANSMAKVVSAAISCQKISSHGVGVRIHKILMYVS